jgi:hypothetical protein
MNMPSKPGRIEALDYLRGYFIAVIIIDHLYRWPSALSIFTGQASLWANASDGFLIISGLLVGYVRGFKARDQPLRTVAKKLTLRSLQLYAWGIGTSLVLVTIQWLLPFKAAMPNIDPVTGDWWGMLTSTVTTVYAHPWIYFLHLYAIYMLLAIGAVWLLRRRLWWAVIGLSLLSLALGQLEYGEWLERLPLFFIPAVAGYYMDTIKSGVLRLSHARQAALYVATIGSFVVTCTTAVLWSFTPTLFSPDLHDALSTIFSRAPMSFGATAIAFIWFVGLFAVFNLCLPIIKRWLGWLLLLFGHRSLAAYILHCIPLLITSYLFVMNDNFWLNSLLGMGSLLSVWLLLRIPLVYRLLPH